MRHDLYCGAIISLGIHFGLASLHPAKTGRFIPTKEPEKIYIPMPMKPDDPVEDQPMGDAKEKSSARDDFRPPTQPDAPNVTRPDSFIVPIQPTVDGPIDRKMTTLPDGFPKGPGGPKGVYALSVLDQRPVAKVQPKPVYPFEMKNRGESGEVVVDFIVGPNGEVRDAYAVRSSHHEFEAAAVQAVSKWKFRPGIKGTEAVSTHMQVPIVFTLHDGE